MKKIKFIIKNINLWDIYFIVIVTAYVIWRAVVFLKRF